MEIRDDLADVGGLIASPAAQAPVSHGVAANAPDPLQLLEDGGPGGDFLDDLLGEGPTGPAQLNPVDPIDELLPPMGEEEDPFFQKASDGREGEGASLANHNPSASDGFAVPGAQSSVIPDDWDDDFLSGIGEPENPVPQPDPQPVPPPREVPAPPPEMPPAAPPSEVPPAPPRKFLLPGNRWLWKKRPWRQRYSDCRSTGSGCGVSQRTWFRCQP